MSDSFTFSSAGQVHELELAMQRAGDWAPAMVKQMCVGDFMSQVRDVLLGRAEITIVEKKPNSLLDFLGEVSIPATTAKFVTKNNFKLKKDGGICSYLGDNLKEWFLSGKGKIENPIGEQALRYGKLLRESVDIPIITELGGEEKSETTLAELYYLMEQQKNGEDGVLLNNDYANIFYIRDSAGVLRAVNAYWYDDGWYARARPVEHPYGWRVGYQVFSRK